MAGKLQPVSLSRLRPASINTLREVSSVSRLSEVIGELQASRLPLRPVSQLRIPVKMLTEVEELRSRVDKLQSRSLRKLVSQVLVGHDLEIVIHILRALRMRSLTGYRVWRMNQHRVSTIQTVLAYLAYCEKEGFVKSLSKPYRRPGQNVTEYTLTDKGKLFLESLGEY